MKDRSPFAPEQILSLRGVAILIIVLGHAMFLHRAFSQDYGLFVKPSTTWIDTLFAWGTDIRMPLFTVLSGLVYALRPVNRQSIAGFFKGKFRRILLPLTVLSICEFYYMHWRISRSEDPLFVISQSLKDYLLIPQSHLWFLYALAWIFLLVSLLDACKILRSIKSWGAVLLLACLINLLGLRTWIDNQLFGQSIPNYLGLASASHLLPFFFIGLGSVRFHKTLMNKTGILIAIGLLLTNLAVLRFSSALIPPTVTSLITGLTTTYLLLHIVWNARPLEWIGHHSYSIFLYHGYGLFLAYELARLTITPPSFWVFLTYGSVIGTLFPIFIHYSLRHIPYLSPAFLGIPHQPLARS